MTALEHIRLAIIAALGCDDAAPMLCKDGWWRVYTTSSGVFGGGPTVEAALLCSLNMCDESGLLACGVSS